MKRKNALANVVFTSLTLTLILSVLAGLTPLSASSEEDPAGAFTHSVFAEFGTATW